jgi:hypothetical protein
MYVCEGFDAEELISPNAARPADASKVVAQQVDDHQIFGAVSLAALKVFPGRCIAAGIAMSWCGSLDGLRRDVRTVFPHESLGRQTHHVSVWGR